MNIAITGNTGFIGSNLIKHLSNMNAVHLFPFDKEKYSLSSTDSLKTFVENQDIIIHLAGINHTQNTEDYYSINVLGTLRLLEAIALYGKPNIQFIFSSSFSVYSESEKHELLSETTTKTKPRNHYGLSKLFAEELVEFYNREYRIPTRILRISNPYGPTNKDIYNGIISILIDKINKGEEITITGDGKQSRDFIFINDIVRAFVNVLNYRGNSLLINICSGKETRIIDVVKKIESLLGKKAILRFNKESNEKGYWIGDQKKARDEICFYSTINIDEGLRRTINQKQST